MAEHRSAAASSQTFYVSNQYYHLKLILVLADFFLFSSYSFCFYPLQILLLSLGFALQAVLMACGRKLTSFKNFWMNKYWADIKFNAVRWNARHKMMNCSMFLPSLLIQLKGYQLWEGGKKRCASHDYSIKLWRTKHSAASQYCTAAVLLSSAFCRILQFIPAMTLKEF